MECTSPNLPQLILFTAFAPNTKEMIASEIEDKLANSDYEYNTMSVDNLISELLNKNNQYNLIDLRSKEEFKKSHIPLAINIPLGELENYEWQDFFIQKFKTNVFYSDKLEDAKKAFLLTEYIGKSQKVILNNPIEGYFSLLQSKESFVSKKEEAVHNWRINSHGELTEREQFLSKFSAPVKKKANIVKGGCS